MNCFMTGATSTVGLFALRSLLGDGAVERVSVLSRSPSRFPLTHEKLTIVPGSLLEAGPWQLAVNGCDTVVHVAGIMFLPQLLPLMRTSAVQQLVVVGTTGVFSRFKSASQEYVHDEDLLRSFLTERPTVRCVVLRPTMIYGNPTGHNVSILLSWFRRHSVFPMFGDGHALIQPIYDADLAFAVVAAVRQHCEPAGFYNVSGRAPLTYRQFIEAIAAAAGTRPFFVHLPVRASAALFETTHRLIPHFRFDGEQVWRTTDDRAFDWSAAGAAFGFAPRSFEDGLRLQLERMGSSAGAER
ncbi:MAG: NAD(P)-dependent oxidoreductase [Caldiserica bacterium]|nr:NAD(P)-dependent oxidoreductase [Caldisericota bacterium]